MGSPWIRSRSLFSQILRDFCSDVPVNVTAKFEVRSFARLWDNSDWSFVWGLGLQTPNFGEEEAAEGRGGTVRKSVVEFL